MFSKLSEYPLWSSKSFFPKAGILAFAMGNPVEDAADFRCHFASVKFCLAELYLESQPARRCRDFIATPFE
jgi:hypothetical protein